MESDLEPWLREVEANLRIVQSSGSLTNCSGSGRFWPSSRSTPHPRATNILESKKLFLPSKFPRLSPEIRRHSLAVREYRQCNSLIALQIQTTTPIFSLEFPFHFVRTWYLLRAGIELTTHNLLQELYRLSHIGTERGGLKTVLTRSARGAGLPPNFGGNSLELRGLGGKMPKPHSQTASHRI